ncbi:MAG: hypothetical protein HC780_06715 [Leptolyngbyaceae cyanobacterium CSU_1_3]|nr:hypothetical protein [Leptolyngbyaceae cyanobacterium CSU_1_3]
MTLEQQLSQQRVKHIVSSYQLDGTETEAFATYLSDLLQTYASPLLELALTETIVAHWLSVTLPRGTSFLTDVHALLKRWEVETIASTLTPNQFQQITGLDPSPVFGSSELPPPSIVQPR